MTAHDELTPTPFVPWDEYWAVRHDEELWTPWIRWALELAEVAADDVAILKPSQYPTARCGDVIVTIYPDASFVFDLEREAHTLLSASDLPIPSLVAAGTFPTQPKEPIWQWLIESVAAGIPWNRARAELAPAKASRAAEAVGSALRSLHRTPHAAGRILNLDWASFDELIEDEVKELGQNDGRLALFPDRFLPGLLELARSTYGTIDTGTVSTILHGDVHGDNVFIEPATGELTSIIDLNEMRVGDPWYDLADAAFRLLRGRPGLICQLLRGYGADLLKPEPLALRLLGWGLVHDFDGLTATIKERGIPDGIDDVQQLAGHLSGLTAP
ncbi:phosphotransferase family protein [Microlunatus soli]|uniref:Aminoglycoside phosphotransferase n=1 Tax=Microlunatus soli TaxID=630515 RepID=A0A1H2A1X2_9ACTN|nr:aminoglycoside phosphotransferase family protein [Microlunatus soli]SDT39859.1 Aminoglycoside phosphotransferase [Microlunatus soli]